MSRSHGNYSFDYLRGEINAFWSLCGAASSTVDQLLRGWNGLFFVYTRCEMRDDEARMAANWMATTQENLCRRLPYREAGKGGE